MTTSAFRYAGFWPRLAAQVIDILILVLIFGPLWIWGMQYRVFSIFFAVMDILIVILWDVYLVRRFGGTPGKLAMGIRIRKLNGEPVGYQEAILRSLPTLLFQVVAAIATVYSVMRITDSAYQALTLMNRYSNIIDHYPDWYKLVNYASEVWFWSEMIVLLTNRKRRALHDFIAGTIVIHTASTQAVQPISTDRANMEIALPQE